MEKLLAIELDHQLVKRLEEHFIDSKSVSILEGNILDIDLKELLEASDFAEHPYKIIANIPYYITAPIIRTLLSLPYQPESMTLMVQDEVADRLAAKPGDMSPLSMMAQYYATVEKSFSVPKEAFDPMPKVKSAVIRIVPKRAYDPEEDRKVFRLARAGFAARERPLANNLSSSLSVPKETVEEKLKRSDCALISAPRRFRWMIGNVCRSFSRLLDLEQEICDHDAERAVIASISPRELAIREQRKSPRPCLSAEPRTRDCRKRSAGTKSLRAFKTSGLAA